MKEWTAKDTGEPGELPLESARDPYEAWHPSGSLTSYVLGERVASQRSQIAQHLLQCPRCDMDVAALTEALSDLALLLRTPPVTASRGLVRAHLLAAVQREPQRLLPEKRTEAPGAARLARFFDISEPQAADLLAALDQPQRWLDIPGAGQFLGVPPGPAYQQPKRMGMLVRVPAAFRMPHHLHHGDEHTLVLRGGYRSSEGMTYHAGDEAHVAAGQHHELYVLPDGECVLALLLHQGIEFTQETDDG